MAVGSGQYSLSFMDQGSGKGGSEREEADQGIKDNPGRETPKKWKGPKDIREGGGQGKDSSGAYPNYSSWKTRSGHSIIMDDTKDKESITIQHRGGSAFQLLPNGAVHMVSSHGNYQVVFGEQRMTVTGAMDITVKGDHSFRTYGDVNHTHHGDYNLTVTGDHNITARNKNVTVRGNYDMIAKNTTIKNEGNLALHTQGATGIVSHKSITVASVTDQANFGAMKGMSFAVKKGNINTQIQEGHLLTKLDKGNVGTTLSEGKYDLALNKGSMKTTVKGGGIDTFSENDHKVTTQASMHHKAGQNLYASASMDSHFDAGQNAHWSAGGDSHRTAGGRSTLDSSVHYAQSGQSQKSQKAQTAANAGPGDPNPGAKGGVKTAMENPPTNRFGNLA